MSIENLKKILESEREEEMGIWDFCTGPVGYRNGHGNATDRLLPLLQKAVEMANFYSSWVNMQDGIVPPGDCETMFVYEPLDKDKNGVTVGGKKAREFLSYFTKMTDIKKESV